MEPSRSSDIPAVRIRGLSLRFDEVEVLRDLELDVYPGEKLAIIGPSGSGKSTLLRVLMGLERPATGSIEVHGTDLWTVHSGDQPRPAKSREVRARCREVSMVFQRFHLFPHKTALQNIMLGPMRALDIPRAEAESRALALLERVGLGDRGGAYPSELSGGQQQRVAIARAMAMDPRVILFDEVTSALDPELVGEVLDIIVDLANRTETTMLLVTHQMGFARAFADRVAVMDEGRVAEIGPPSVVFGAPQHERTQRFLAAVSRIESYDLEGPLADG